MYVLKARKVGNSIGIILPKEMLEALHVREGDTIYASKTPDGMSLTPYDPDFEAAMEAFDIERRRYRNALRELAK
ncbi:MAG: AbrB/MazE/SpoVT family DNA-binding domain-containing protein [Candidatus Competibacteraceae bacterium]|nr:AbrB/MazE/SpoVT family DNA-binding domain-containing protein [Candidatus Competibacteraceae bacterium]